MMTVMMMMMQTKQMKSWLRSLQIDMHHNNHNKSFTLNFKFVKLKTQIISKKISKFTKE